MIRSPWHIVPALAIVALILSAPARMDAQQKADHPKLRAALHELREARGELKEAKDTWPPGYKERALGAINEAIKSVQTILAVKDVDTFRGVDRDNDYYKRYSDHPRLRAALEDLRDARDELRSAKADFGNKKEQALENIEMAIGDILTLMRNNKR